MARILVVDDDPDVIELCKIFVGDSHEISGETDGVRAIEHLRKRAFDLLITDVRMPGCNGFRLIHQARAIQPALAVIVMSALYNAHDPTSRAIMEAFAPVAMEKPFGLRSLHAAISAALVVLGRAA